MLHVCNVLQHTLRSRARTHIPAPPQLSCCHHRQHNGFDLAAYACSLVCHVREVKPFTSDPHNACMLCWRSSHSLQIHTMPACCVQTLTNYMISLRMRKPLYLPDSNNSVLNRGGMTVSCLSTSFEHVV